MGVQAGVPHWPFRASRGPLLAKREGPEGGRTDAQSDGRAPSRTATLWQAGHGGRTPVNEQELTASIRTIERAASALATASVARMDDVLPWFRGLPADQRAWVMLVAQAGVRSFVEWMRQGGDHGPRELSDEIFEAAPRTLAR